jgi:hypothetical protein
MVTTNFFGLEHLPIEFAAGAALTGWGLAYSELAPTIYSGGDLHYAVPRIKNNKIVFGPDISGGSYGVGATYILLSKLIGNVTPRKVIIGFRHETIGAVSGAPPVFGTSPANNTTTSAGFLPLKTTAATPLPDGYYEIIFDFVASTYTVMFNGGVYTAATSLGSSGLTAANFKTNFWTIGHPYTVWFTPAVDVFAISDIYSMVSIDPADDALIKPLGPITLKRLPVLSTTGAGYTPPGGSNIVDALNTRRAATASLSAPKVGVAADNTPLRVKVDASSLSFVTVRGISVKVAAVKDVAGDKTLSVALASNGTTNASVPVTMTAAAAPLDASPGGLLTMPDGSGLTIASLSNLEVVLSHA